MVRSKRKKIEDFYCVPLLQFAEREFGSRAELDISITDRPDALISVGGRKIAAELTQMPSSYIIRHLVGKMPPKFKKNAINGVLLLSPFEPHRWVHTAVTDKIPKVLRDKSKRYADEAWIVLHSHSVDDPWPMSKAENSAQRSFESALMRFGVSKIDCRSVNRIVYIYPDHTVVEIYGPGVKPVEKITIDPKNGYPTVKEYRWAFSYDVPLAGLGVREFEFPRITFDETIVVPKDELFKGLPPCVSRPDFGVRGIADTQKLEFELLRDGKVIGSDIATHGSENGNRFDMYNLLRYGIDAQPYNVEE